MRNLISNASLKAAAVGLVTDILGGASLSAEEVQEALRQPRIADSMVDSPLRKQLRELVTVELLDSLAPGITSVVVKGVRVYAAA